MTRILDYFIVNLLELFERNAMFPGIGDKNSRAAVFLSVLFVSNVFCLLVLLGIKVNKYSFFVFSLIVFTVFSFYYSSDATKERIRKKKKDFTKKDFTRGARVIIAYALATFVFLLITLHQ